MRFLNSVFVILFCAVVFSVGFSLPVSAQQSGGHAGIAIVVNEDAVSMDDLNDRLNLIMTSSGLPNNEDTRQKILPQIIGSLVEEQLKLQEADRIEIQVSQGEINEGLRTIAQQNNLELEQFKEMISKGGLSIETMERQIRAEIAWGKVIQARMRSKVVISEGDVDSVLDRLEKNVGKTEYLASEILLAVDENAGESEVSALAQNLVQQMRSGQAPFSGWRNNFQKRQVRRKVVILVGCRMINCRRNWARRLKIWKKVRLVSRFAP